MSAEAVAPEQQPTKIEETMMPQPGIAPTVQVQAPQPGSAYAYPAYPGAKVQVAVAHTRAAPAEAGPAPTGDTCVDGKSQSPINIELNVEPAQLPVLAWRLTAPDVVDGIFAPVQEEGQGKWLRVVDAGLSMAVKGADYQLRSLIVHSPSEHTVSGQRYDMELQFLHSTMVGEQQQYLMVSALVNKADPAASSPALSGLAAKMQDMDAAGQISVNIRELALAALGQTELVSPTATNAENYFMYDGSFTTSPCTEGVTWVILKNALQASAVDIEALAAALPQTNRPLQAVGQRVVQDRKVLGYAA
jgi:carbonic anhydrase